MNRLTRADPEGEGDVCTAGELPRSRALDEDRAASPRIMLRTRRWFGMDEAYRA